MEIDPSCVLQLLRFHVIFCLVSSALQAIPGGTVESLQPCHVSVFRQHCGDLHALLQFLHEIQRLHRALDTNGASNIEIKFSQSFIAVQVVA